MRALVGDATEREAKTEASAWFRMDEARVRRGERCCTPWLRGLRNLRGEGGGGGMLVLTLGRLRCEGPPETTGTSRVHAAPV